MWPFKQVEPKLPKFGSTEQCRACGSSVIKRIYNPGCWEIAYPEHIVATCEQCGCPHHEQLKGVPNGRND